MNRSEIRRPGRDHHRPRRQSTGRRSDPDRLPSLRSRVADRLDCPGHGSRAGVIHDTTNGDRGRDQQDLDQQHLQQVETAPSEHDDLPPDPETGPGVGSASKCRFSGGFPRIVMFMLPQDRLSGLAAFWDLSPARDENNPHAAAMGGRKP